MLNKLEANNHRALEIVRSITSDEDDEDEAIAAAQEDKPVDNDKNIKPVNDDQKLLDLDGIRSVVRLSLLDGQRFRDCLKLKTNRKERENDENFGKKIAKQADELAPHTNCSKETIQEALYLVSLLPSGVCQVQ